MSGDLTPRTTRVLWNGHLHQFDVERNGAPEDGVEYVLWRMKEHVLHPAFEGYGNFLYRPRPIAGAPEWPPGVMRFSGNFVTYSHSFCVETDDPALIARIAEAVRENQARPEYAAAKAEIAEHKKREDERRARIEAERERRRRADALRALGLSEDEARLSAMPKESA